MRLSRGWLLCWALYAATMVGATWLLWSARNNSLARLDDPANQAAWQEWQRQEAARDLAGDSPIERRPPSSHEPPTLVLLRDHFPAVLASCWILGSVLFAFTAWVIRGVMTASPQHPPR